MGIDNETEPAAYEAICYYTWFKVKDEIKVPANQK